MKKNQNQSFLKIIQRIQLKSVIVAIGILVNQIKKSFKIPSIS